MFNLKGSVVCIIFGILTLLVSIFGLYSTAKDQRRFLFVYGLFLSILFLIQFITGVAGLGTKNSSKFNSLVEGIFEKEFTLNTTHPSERDFYQSHFKCCGWKSLNDYMVSGTLNAPKSCCINQATCDTSSKSNLYDSFCNIKIIDASKSVIDITCGVLVTFSLFSLFTAILSFLQYHRITRGYHYS